MCFLYVAAFVFAEGGTMQTPIPHHIQAVSVNHNTSRYLELMLRSLFAQHPVGLNLAVSVFDNASTDGTDELVRYAERVGVPVRQSGWPRGTHGNSHGDVLRRFVLDRPGCSHYLFLDADVVFIEPNTIQTMLSELERTPGAFAIGPRMSWDGANEIPAAARQSNPDICSARLHPCCALVRNTPVFRSVVDLIGCSCATYHWADRDEFLDTFKLMTRVMLTHGLRHILSSALVRHFFCTSYDWDDEATRTHKIGVRDQLLAELRHAEL